ncbi:hypothetical protein D9M71_813770 [compost metagenome]
MRYGAKAISTQFHPEFTSDIAAACIRRRATALKQEGKDPEVLLAGLGETPDAARLLLSFVESSYCTHQPGHTCKEENENVIA